MTVCIAAVCNVSDIEQALILCTDGKGSGPLGSKEVVLKNRSLSQGWRCLTAGGDADLNALLPVLGKKLREQTRREGVDESNIATLIREAARARKLEKINEYTQGRYAIGYDEFLKSGKSVFPEDQFRADIFAISQIDLDVDCIIAGFPSGSLYPMLLTLNNSVVSVLEDFAVAGEGGYLAQSALTQRQHSDVTPYERAMYHVFEAKKHAERVSSVNDVTMLSVMRADGRVASCNFKSLTYLRTQYGKYAPQPISEPIVIGDDYFVELGTPVA